MTIIPQNKIEEFKERFMKTSYFKKCAKNHPAYKTVKAKDPKISIKVIAKNEVLIISEIGKNKYEFLVTM